jgi:hypothetical protein
MARFDLIDGSSDRFCIYTRDGKRCRARRMAGSELCFFHNPAMATERTAAQKSGGLRNKAAVLPADTPDLALVSPQQVTMLVAATINETRRGEIDPKINTVHLRRRIALTTSNGGGGLSPRRRSGKLLILRLTARGLRRLRLETTRSCRISSSARS